jgi:ABC-type Fe3+ transport system permease subunit
MFAITNLHQTTRAGLVGFSLAVAAVVLAPVYLICVSLWPLPAAELASLTKGPFGSAAIRSILQVGLVAALSLPLGMLIGLLFSLTNSHLRGLTLFLLLLPLMLPPFLWSIGWSSLRRFFAYRHQFWFDGLPGCLLTFATATVPLVALATILTVRALSSTHLSVLRLAGGYSVLLRNLAKYAFPLAASVAILGSIFAVADPGAAQIMGYHGAASTILIDFSARHDFHAAALKTCTFLFLLLPLVLLFGYWASSRVNAELLGADLIRYRSAFPRAWSVTAGIAAPVLALLTVLPPALGILWPLAGTKASQVFKFALPALTTTAGTTFFIAPPRAFWPRARAFLPASARLAAPTAGAGC